MNSFIHHALKKRVSSHEWPYMSSIMIVNKNIPFFEEHFGQLDYDWLVSATEDRWCVGTYSLVRRRSHNRNLSMNPEYRKRDFYIGLINCDGDVPTMKRWFASRARYFYVQGDMKMARFFFLRGSINWKTTAYYLTTFINPLRKWIIKKYKVFG